jgi:hypothetical protein
MRGPAGERNIPLDFRRLAHGRAVRTRCPDRRESSRFHPLVSKEAMI